jgi:hypothetical protein
MKIKLSFFLLLLNLNVLAQSESIPFISGEELHYSVYYHWGFFWMEAGEVEFRVDTLKKDNQSLLQMQSIGNTLPKYDWLFTVRDTFYSEALYPSFQPQIFKRNNLEGKSWVRNRYNFHWEDNYMSSVKESNEKALVKEDIPLPNKQVLDVQTAVYFARLWDLENAKVGEVKKLILVLDGEFFTVPMTYLGHEKVRLKNGQEQSCFKISTQVVEGLIFRANQNIDIYISTDPSRIPLVVKAPILIGRVEAYLKNFD